MILLFAEQTSPRLQYILQLLSKHWQIDVVVTNDKIGYNNYDGACINYSNIQLKGITVPPHTLLFEPHIKKQSIIVFEEESLPALFGMPGKHDVLSDIFYLITRYEEYTIHTTDEYGRFAHSNSIAFENGFLNMPVVDIRIAQLKKKLQTTYPLLNFPRKTFQFIPTYDIDIAYSFKYKGLLRNAGGFIKHPSYERIEVLIDKAKDPYDCYTYLHALHKTLPDVKPVYFFLVAEKKSRYDKNISPHHKAMQILIREHAALYEIGLHPSWRSFDNPELISKEKSILEEIINKPINKSRMHYIKMQLPDTYVQLLKAGIKEDYSMGYGSINGFRASTAHSFQWYNLTDEKSTELLIHPFCFMDANSHFEQKQTPEISYNELLQFYKIIKDYELPMITVFHNSILGSDAAFSGWENVYMQFTSHFRLMAF